MFLDYREVKYKKPPLRAGRRGGNLVVLLMVGIWIPYPPKIIAKVIPKGIPPQSRLPNQRKSLV